MIYFYKNKHGEIFPADEKTAQIYEKQGLPQIGTSDGAIYNQYVKAGKETTRVLLQRIVEIEGEIEQVEAGVQKLKYEEFVADTDERLVRATAKLDRLKEELDKSQKEHSKKAHTFLQEALEAEIEAATGKLVTPPDTTYAVYNKAGRLVTDELEKMRILGA